MATTKTYLLVPDHDFPAGGPVILGSIIHDPLDPGESRLNQGQIVKIPSESTYTSHKKDWKLTIESPRNGHVSVWAHFVSLLGLGGFPGGNFGASFDTKTINEYLFDDLETTFFYPSQTYVEAAVNRPKVRAWLKGSRYKSPVYMITGLKIVRGASSEVMNRREKGREGHANFGLAGMMAGDSVAVDAANSSLRKADIEETSFRGGSPFVIGYRLCKITFQKNAEQDQVPKQEKYVAGAFFGVEDDKEQYRGASSLPVIVLREGEEAVARELSAKNFLPAVDEDDNEDCQCFNVQNKSNG